jgi:hypothetical protein
MNNPHVLSAVIIFYLLLLTPPISFLAFAWRLRRKDLLDGLTEPAIRSYFEAFHNIPSQKIPEPRKAFEAYYSSQYGRSRFIIPLFLFAGISGLLLCWSAPSLVSMLDAGAVGKGQLPALAIFSIMGAFMWILSDEIARSYSVIMSPADIYWWSFRIVIAVPMGYAVSAAVKEPIAPPIAFLLGAFPIAQLMSIARRIAAQKLGLSDSAENEISELQSLQGVDIRHAERFASEGISTILQLAYCDPIKLAIRTGFSYSFVTDCICQALLWIYVEKDKATLRRCGLRSAYEVRCVWHDLASGDAVVKANADKVVQEAAAAINCPEASFRNALEQVAEDPYTEFLYLSWSGVVG